MFRLAGVSCSARPFAISGTALANPPLPVLVPTPVPDRLNHVSRVNCCAPSPAVAAPKSTYCDEPLNCSPFATAPPVVVTAVSAELEELLEPSTATTA